MTTRVEPTLVLTREGAHAGERTIAIETAVAIEVNGIGYAVLMATPAALADLATGFLLTERLIDALADILDLDSFETPAGWIVRATVAERCAGRIHDRVRHRTSDTACGLCGVSGLEQVVRPVARRAPAPHTSATAVFLALDAIRAHQPLTAATGALHAAALCDTAGAIVAAREDVGRHNALDKLIGACAPGRLADGFVLVTSRISFEMVDKALVAGAPLLVGISAPTALAVDHARAHGLSLVALARNDSVLVLNDPHHAFAARL
ncbi:formate dehydrogenase accessory sulfurtransferase FdhD [Sphingomonas sp. NFR15]|uniref:formate dehydrogenase accessory sulfurtransferase FdhD n=1 Tax=Sphingomonas sp. NFR15 TaxID=1566282 RepID=UPI00087ED30F|nr:formate dehydrogenase accessory sulfurtransferase FdhD [Sphingomonas sp. NFR15]SDA29241.1 FdhD protein [Sphingomonas sp. NFR15]